MDATYDRESAGMSLFNELMRIQLRNNLATLLRSIHEQQIIQEIGQSCELSDVQVIFYSTLFHFSIHQELYFLGRMSPNQCDTTTGLPSNYSRPT